MRFRLLIPLLIISLLTGCPFDKSKKEAKKGKDWRANDPTPDQNGDVGFQSFIGRLRIAVRNKDRAMLASMMASDFGYRWDTPPPNEDPFTYWDQNSLWGELELIATMRWEPFQGFMIAPGDPPDHPDYRGYRAGVRQVQGRWRFVYFVPPPPNEPSQPGQPTQLEQPAQPQ